MKSFSTFQLLWFFSTIWILSSTCTAGKLTFNTSSKWRLGATEPIIWSFNPDVGNIAEGTIGDVLVMQQRGQSGTLEGNSTVEASNKQELVDVSNEMQTDFEESPLANLGTITTDRKGGVLFFQVPTNFAGLSAGIKFVPAQLPFGIGEVCFFCLIIMSPDSLNSVLDLLH
jgi:hypothetical protein